MLALLSSFKVALPLFDVVGVSRGNDVLSACADFPVASEVLAWPTARTLGEAVRLTHTCEMESSASSTEFGASSEPTWSWYPQVAWFSFVPRIKRSSFVPRGSTTSMRWRSLEDCGLNRSWSPMKRTAAANTPVCSSAFVSRIRSQTLVEAGLTDRKHLQSNTGHTVGR